MRKVRSNPRVESVDGAIEALLDKQPIETVLHDLLEMGYKDYRKKKGRTRMGVGALAGLPLFPIGSVAGAGIGHMHHHSEKTKAKDKADYSKNYGGKK